MGKLFLARLYIFLIKFINPMSGRLVDGAHVDNPKNFHLKMEFCCHFFVQWIMCLKRTDSFLPLSTVCLAVGGAMGTGLDPSTASTLDLHAVQTLCWCSTGCTVRQREMPCKYQQVPWKCRGYCAASVPSLVKQLLRDMKDLWNCQVSLLEFLKKEIKKTS